MPTTIHSILEEIRENAQSNRGQGDDFERLMKSYLKTDPKYQNAFSEVWVWNEWPERGNQVDTGIDLVAKDRSSGEYCAIQCKFFDPAHNLQKADIDSFFTASGKEPFKQRMIISTTDKWSRHADDACNNQQIPVQRLRIQDLEESPIDWSQYSRSRKLTRKEQKKLRPHQQDALDNVLKVFRMLNVVSLLWLAEQARHILRSK